MATSTFSKSDTDESGAITSALRQRVTNVFGNAGDIIRLVPFISAPPDTSEKIDTKNTPRVYDQNPRRTLDSLFNQHYLDRLVQGEPAIEQHFFAYFTKLLLVSLRFKLRSVSHAEDATQETLLRVLQSIRRGEIHFPDRLPGFVRSVADNVANEIIRKNKKFDPIPENHADPIEKALSAEIKFIRQEYKDRILRALPSLSDKDRKLIAATLLLDRDKDEICTELKIDRGALRVRLFRAIARLRAAMGLVLDHPKLDVPRAKSVSAN